MSQHLCPSNHVTEHYYSPSSIPRSIPCEVCGVESTLDPSPHLTRPASTGFRVPIVIDIHGETGKPSFPGSPDDPIEKGYTRIELRSMRDYEKFSRQMDASETASTRERIAAEHSLLSSETKARREAIDSELRRRGITSSKLRDLAREYVDRKREARHCRLVSKTAGFHNRVLEYDSRDKQRISNFER